MTINPSDVASGQFDDESMHKRLRRACQEAGGVNMWSRLHGFNNSNVIAMMKGRRGIPDSVCKALKIENKSRHALDSGHKHD